MCEISYFCALNNKSAVKKTYLDNKDAKFCQRNSLFKKVFTYLRCSTNFCPGFFSVQVPLSKVLQFTTKFAHGFYMTKFNIIL